MTSSTAISQKDYQAFQQYLEKACGIVLADNKHYLVSSRLNKIMQEESLADLGALVQALTRSSMGTLRTRVIDAMTTNETLWFRDRYPYDILLKDIFPQSVAARKTDLRIWSAACSSGQEPYSISMYAQEFSEQSPSSRLNVRITATDISSSILNQARQGEYDAFSLGRGLSPQMQKKYFDEVGGIFRIKNDIQRRVEFRFLNLLESYSGLPRFDVIFCRNVLIYFSQDAKRDIVRRMADQLQPGGYLFLGASEAITMLSDRFEMIRAHGGVVFRLRH